MKCKYLVDPLFFERCGEKGKKRQMIYGTIIFCDKHFEMEKQKLHTTKKIIDKKKKRGCKK